MKRLLLFLGIILLTFLTNAQSIPLYSAKKSISKGNDNFTSFQAAFSYNKIEGVTIEGTEKGTFSAITIEGAFIDGELGMPGLPVFTKMIAVPVGATPIVTVKNHSTNEYSLDEYGFHTVFPVQPSVRKDQNPDEIPFEFNEKAYLSDKYNDSPIAEINVMGTMRGVRIAMLVVRPVQYNPADNTVRVFNDIEIEVSFENGDYKKTQELYKNTCSHYFANSYSSIFNSGVHRDVFSEHPDLYNTPVRMLVITNRIFEATLQPWIEWKTKKGFYLDVNYTDDIGTTAAAIKTFCHNKYNQGISDGTAPTFIVIVGDIQQVPASQTGTQSKKATDFYYAETTGDLFPEMYYSRMSAQTTQQLQNIIDKTLYYEQYQFEDPGFLDNVLLIAGWESSQNFSTNWCVPQINYANTHYYNSEHGYSQITKFLGPPYTGYHNAFNNLGFANYSAHCNETNWQTYTGSYLTVAQVNAFTNVNKYFVAMANCCLSADFGTNECIGEAMIRAQNKAAVAYIGSSPSTYWAEDLHFSVGAYKGSTSPATPNMENTTLGCYDLMFRDADFNCLSSHVFAGNLAVTHAHTNSGYTLMSNLRYYWEAYNVLGDGSIMPYNGQAAVNEVSHLAIVPIGHTTYEVNAAPGSYIAISKDGVIHGVAIADDSGVALVTLEPPILTKGDVDIVVTRNQYQPYIQVVPASVLDGPYVLYQNYLLTDLEGNANQSVAYDSTVDVDITLKNIGTETATNCSIELISNNEYVTINNSIFALGDIDAEEIINFEKIFNFSVSKYVPDQSKIDFLTVVSPPDVEEKWISKFSITANAPKLISQKFIITEITGNGNNRIDAGETLKISIPVSNIGHAKSYPLTATLRANLLAVEVLTSTTNNDGIEAGESGYLDFIISTSENIEVGAELTLKLIVKSDIFSFETEMSYIVGLVIEDFERGDFTAFDWQLSGNKQWTVTNSEALNGSYCAKSGTISHNQSTTLSITMDIEYDGEISFWRKVSSEEKYDNLEFFINGSSKGKWAGALDWEKFTYPIQTGENTFKWTYTKDISQSSGLDCAWLDDIAFLSMPLSINAPPFFTQIDVTNAIFGEPYLATLTAEDPDGEDIMFVATQIPQWMTLTDNGDGTATLSGIPKYDPDLNFISISITDGFYLVTEDIDFVVTSENEMYEITFDLTVKNLPTSEVTGTLKIIGDFGSETKDFSINGEHGEHGIFTLFLSDGNYTYSIVIGGYDTAEEEFEVNGEPKTIYITMNPSVYEITFDVKDIYNLPISDALIGISRINSVLHTKEDGTVSVELPNGIYNFVVTKEDYDIVEDTFEVNGEPKTIDVKMINIGINSVEYMDITIYPNPTKGELRIRNYECGIMDVEIFDAFGRMQNVESRKQKSETFVDISHLSSGIYFVKITTEKGVITQKVVKK